MYGCACGAALEPEDHVFGGGFEHEFEIRAEKGYAVFEAGSFVEIGEAFEIGFDEPERGANGQVEVAGGFEKFFAVGKGMAAVGGHRERGEKHARTLAELLGESGDLRCGGFAAEQDFGVAGQIFEAKVGERAAEILRGDFLKLVSLVEDDRGGFRQNTGIWRVAGLRGGRRCRQKRGGD
ncbi:MAG: hypothetical protein WDM87_09350 [Terracidiphilus sp.]